MIYRWHCSGVSAQKMSSCIRSVAGYAIQPDYPALLKRHNLRVIMSVKGCCYDNAYAESFFHSLKVECIHGEHYISREIMRTTVFNYIEWGYNR